MVVSGDHIFVTSLEIIDVYKVQIIKKHNKDVQPIDIKSFIDSQNN